MKIALFQYNIRWEDKEANKRRIREIIENSPRRGEPDWIVFSEMTLSGFTMNTSISELSEADTAFFSDLATENHCNISFGGVEKGYNKLITLDRDGKRINTYSKIHLYSFGQEDRHYKPGKQVEIFNLEGFRVVPSVCFDLRFPYLFWSMAEHADVFVNIAAWPARRSAHWQGLLFARAVENQAYCLGVNRIGTEGKLDYSGNSVCYDPLGKVVADAGTVEGMCLADVPLDPGLVAKTRERFPFLKERKDASWKPADLQG